MSEISKPSLTIGYCTNVHAGVDLPEIRHNLQHYAVAVRDAVRGPDQRLGVGLWLPATAAKSLGKGDETAQFAEFLRHHRLRPYTINGFPFDNFHQPVVKRDVYVPTWWQSERLEYTCALADVLAELLAGEDGDPGAEMGSISTLPIGWPGEQATPERLQQAGANFRKLADHLRDLESRTGRRIVVAIEPEPGCLLDSCDDVIEWFEQQLPDQLHRRYLTVCHDVCHSAVMMESQANVIQRYRAAGIAIGKVQVSSAIVVDWAMMADPRRTESLEQLSKFAEDRYLHQTGRCSKTEEFQLAEDLPDLIESFRGRELSDQKWVVHFHVPIFLERFGHLGTSQQDILDCLRTLLDDDASREQAGDAGELGFTGHLEIETYAWTVLPESMRRHGLAADIAGEFRWLESRLGLEPSGEASA